MRSSLLISSALILLSGCTAQVTDLSPDGPDGAPSPTPPETADPAVGIAATDSFEMGLREVSGMTFNVTGFNGFTGTVTVTASNLPAGVTSTPVTVDVTTSDVAVPANIEFSSSNADAIPADYSGVILTAEAASITAATDDFALTLKAELATDTRNDVNNLDVDDLWGHAVAGEGLVIHMGSNTGVFVSFTNRSAATHLIHGSGTANGGINNGSDYIGMDHGNTGSTEGNTNMTQTRELRPTTLPMTVTFYCHTHGSPTFQEGKITLKP